MVMTLLDLRHAADSATATGVFTLAGALGGVIISGTVAFVSTRFTARDSARAALAQRSFEIARTDRDARRALYSSYLSLSERVFRLAVRIRADVDENRATLRDEAVGILEPLVAAEMEMALLGSEGTSRLSNQLRLFLAAAIFTEEPLAEWPGKATGLRAKLVTQMRNDLGEGQVQWR